MITETVEAWACDSCEHIAVDGEYGMSYCPECKDETVYNDVTDRLCPMCGELRDGAEADCDECGYENPDMMCGTCSGTGEGMYERTRCPMCHGRG